MTDKGIAACNQFDGKIVKLLKVVARVGDLHTTQISAFLLKPKQIKWN